MATEIAPSGRKSASGSGVRNAVTATGPATDRAAEDSDVSADQQQVYERLYTAIIEHSLPPGTRLVENKLCEIFGLGRTRIRQVLQRLANERIVTLTLNRGAVVSRPTVKDARDVFAARKLIEAGVTEMACARATRSDIGRLREQLACEQAAWKNNDRRAMIRLSGEFHLYIAEIADNGALTEVLRELISRSSLIVAVFQAPGAKPCPPDEHEALVAALEKRDPAVVSMMVSHLDHVLNDLALEDRDSGDIDLRSVLSSVA